jgi:Na+/H+ antiporter NhaD/arsenite permease-like protein
MNYFILIVFVLTYLFLIIGRVNKLWIVLTSTVLLLITGTISFPQAFHFVNWNVLALFVGMLILADLFIDSKVPAFLASSLASRAKNTAFAFLFICVLASFISAFVENVATVLIIAPIAICLAQQMKIKAAPLLIGIAICSNLQGTATLIGDPPSMLLAGWTKMTFNDFFWFKGAPGIFFAVQAGAIISFLILYFIFKKYKSKVGKIEPVRVNSWTPTILLILLIISLTLASVLAKEKTYLIGVITLGFGLIGIIWLLAKRGFKALPGLFKPLDWNTTFFLLFIFILVGSLEPGGVIAKLTEFLKSITGGNAFLTYSLIVWFSVLCSAFIDNVPYLVMMLHVVAGLSVGLGVSPYLLYFGLLIGASVGGNITPIGASANIVAVGLAKSRAGEKIGFGQFVKIGLPFTIVAVFAAWLFGWFFWKGIS